MNTARLAALLLATLPAAAQTRPPGELAWALHSEPRTFDPAKVDDQAAEAVRFLTAGVLVRVNRQTRSPEPALAQSWTLSPDGKLLTFRLRLGLRFSDGTPLTSKDVAFSLHRVLTPATAAPVAEEFLTPAEVRIDTPDALTIKVTLTKRVINILNVFDEIAIEPADRPSEARITAGPFFLQDRKPGQSLQLARNPNFWKHNPSGAQLPYASAVHLDILANRDQELARFTRGDYDLIDGLPPDSFNLLAAKMPSAARDLGPSLNTEQLWFNQSPAAPLPDYERAWFRSQPFRVAVSQAIHRADLARIAYEGRATPAHTYISPANAAWALKALTYPPEDVAAATRLLAANGFHKQGGKLVDSAGHPVHFSILTNAGNAPRARMAALIQQDMAALGIDVTIVTLDFPALIERLQHTQNYEACLLGTANVDPDPNSMLNQWLSSSPDHTWNPSESSPATPWEAEIDAAMRAQATAPAMQDRRKAVDRVQQIVADQQPFLYLVYPNKLYAVSPQLQGVAPVVFQPGLVWNIEYLRRTGPSR